MARRPSQLLDDSEVPHLPGHFYFWRHVPKHSLIEPRLRGPDVGHQVNAGNVRVVFLIERHTLPHKKVQKYTNHQAHSNLYGV